MVIVRIIIRLGMAAPQYKVTMKKTTLEPDSAVCSVPLQLYPEATKLKDRTNIIKSARNYLIPLNNIIIHFK